MNDLGFFECHTNEKALTEYYIYLLIEKNKKTKCRRKKAMQKIA